MGKISLIVTSNNLDKVTEGLEYTLQLSNSNSKIDIYFKEFHENEKFLNIFSNIDHKQFIDNSESFLDFIKKNNTIDLMLVDFFHLKRIENYQKHMEYLKNSVCDCFIFARFNPSK